MAGFYANENLSARLVDELRNLGHDVLTSYEAGNANQHVPDKTVLATATASNRCVITFNRKDFVALHREGIAHEGIIICKDDKDHVLQASMVHRLLSKQETLRNRLFRVLKLNQKGINKPSFAVREYRL